MSYRRRLRRTILLRLLDRRKEIIIALGVLFAIVCVIAGLFAWFTHSERFAIADVVVHGNKVIEGEALGAQALGALQGKYLGVFKKDNTLIYPKDTVRTLLHDTYSRIKDISISRDGAQALDVFVEEHEPFALWCGSKHVPDERCYFIDETGYIFDVAPNFSGDVYIRYYGDIGTTTPLRASYITPETMKRVADFLVLLEKVSFEPLAFSVTVDGDYVIEVRGGVSLLVAPDAPLVQVLENLAVVTESEKFREAMQDSERTLEYIDMRFDNKVFYRFQEEQFVE